MKKQSKLKFGSQAQEGATLPKSPPKPPSKLIHGSASATSRGLHDKISTQEDDNLGLQSVHGTEQAGEQAVKGGKKLYQRQKRKKALQKGYGAKNRAQTTATTAKKATEKVRDGAKALVTSITKNPKLWLILVALFLLVLICLSAASAMTTMFQGAMGQVVSSSYTSENEELTAVEANYTALETALTQQIDNIPTDYAGYDQYNYNLDSILHDAHQLAAFLTAKYQYYTADQVDSYLGTIFDEQYTLTLTSESETRYDDDGFPYTYTTLNVTLVNHGLDTVASNLLTAEELVQYEIYIETQGNNPYVFGGGTSNTAPSTDISNVDFVDGTRTGNQAIVDIALAQEGNVGGQPYWSWYGFTSRVEWCACFVSWVLDQSGYDEPVFASCSTQGVPWFASQGQWASGNYADIAAGDIIFFDWDGDNSADHVGIVIGTDGDRVYTVEGNSGDACKIRDYALDSSVILGYGLMN